MNKVVVKGTYDEVNFKANPNFVYKEDIAEKACAIAGSCNFEIIYSEKYKQPCLLIGDKDTHKINLISIPDKKILQSLEGHKELILNIRYFAIGRDDEYIVSSDRKGIVIVWDIKNDFTLVKSFETKYETFIYSCLLFMKDDVPYVVASCIGGNAGTKVFNLKTGESTREIKNENDSNIYFLLYWEHNGNDYAIQCGKSKVIISNLLKDETYAKLDTEKDGLYNMGGMIFKQKEIKDGNPSEEDFLIVTATYGIVNVFNLNKKQNVHNFKLDQAHLYNVLRWNENYFIILNSFPQKLEIIDSKNNFKVLSEIHCPEFQYERYIKKVIHPEFGECLVSVSPLDNRVKLWVNRNFKTD